MPGPDPGRSGRRHGPVGRAEDEWGAVEVLVASAGAGFSARIERTSDADWNRMLELNLTAPFRCLRRAAPAMRAAGYGRIVVIASTASRIGEPYLAAYAASKHGVDRKSTRLNSSHSSI